jgi:hypothetical protein
MGTAGRKAMLLTFAGETLPVAVWAKRAGINPQTLKARIRVGWALAEALSTPAGVRRASVRRKPRACPRMHHHKPLNLAYVAWRVRGKRRWLYFGPWESDKAKLAYNRFQRNWANGYQP